MVWGMSELTQQDLASRILAALTSLRELLATLDDEATAAPSVLPGWTRAHVVAHIDGFAKAAKRQLDTAGTEDPFPMYDGGPEGRDTDIEMAALMRSGPLVARTNESLGALESAVRATGTGQWDLATGFRGGGSVAELFHAIWRELVIHTSDLALDRTVADWEPEFCAHLFDELVVRVPEGRRYVLQPHGAQRIILGDGEDATVLSGTDFDLAAWLAGREPVGPVQATADGDGTDLPELGPWPSGQKSKKQA